MLHANRAVVAFPVFAFVLTAPVVRAQDAKRAEREAMYYRYLDFASYVKGGSITPHWMADGGSFWCIEEETQCC